MCIANPYLVNHANNKPLLLDLVGLDGVFILKDLACTQGVSANTKLKLIIGR